MAAASRQSAPSLWVERPEVQDAPVARVALLAAFDGEYSYAVPPEFVDSIAPGKRVAVPFGRGGNLRPAFCVSVARGQWKSSLKLVGDVLDSERLLSDHLLELGRWISQYYFTPLGRTLAALVPEPIRRQSGFVVRRIVRLAPQKEGATGRTGEAAKIEPVAQARVSSRLPRNSAKRSRAIKLMEEHPDGLELSALIERAQVSKAIVAAMVKAGQLRIETQKVPAAAPDFDAPGPEPAFELNAEQRAAIARIDEISREGAFRAILLHGVSGSGKTEVYIHAIRAVVARGKQAILLVPEIALTTQLVQRLASRFRDVAVIHSGLTGVQRSLTWSAIARGEKKVIIGTRSAIFSPCPDLGLIVVDEEQEASFKNQQSPRFHTRDVAIKRAQMLGIPVVLGSATPSLETWHNCSRLKHFERISLPQRVAGLELPRVEFVDLNEDQKTRRHITMISARLSQALQETLAAGHQAILLLNRRGYASYLACMRCKTPVTCPRCRTNLVYHQTPSSASSAPGGRAAVAGLAVCHHCGSRLIMPNHCGDITCGGKLVRLSMGTQRLEEELRTAFPQARIARADSDALTKVAHYEQIVRKFQERRIDILLGTQMIAKGLDFPFVSLVGVVSADTSLHAPDFRATERTFQLVTQVAGRAGRSAVSHHAATECGRVRPAGGREGEDRYAERASGNHPAIPSAERTLRACVIVQSSGPPAPALRLAAEHRYEPFAEHELPIRKSLGWPPFSRVARIIVSHARQKTASDSASALVARIREHVGSALRAQPTVQILGPQTAAVARLRNMYRFEFLIRCPDANRLLQVLEHLRHNDILTPNTSGALVDVDPVSVL